jgi:hypothetical protein
VTTRRGWRRRPWWRGPAGSAAAYVFLAPRWCSSASSSSSRWWARLVLSVTDFDIYGIADHGNVRFVGLANYARLLETPLFWIALRNTFYFALVGGPLSIAVSLGAALLVNAKAPCVSGLSSGPCTSPHSSPRWSPWPSCGATCTTRGTVSSTTAWGSGASPGGLAGRPAVGHAGHHPHGGVEELRLQHADLHRRAPEHPRGAVRGGTDRWRERAAPVLARDAAVAGADAAGRVASSP